MKYLKLLTFIIAFCASAFTSLFAQHIDQERMNRDINISKQILGELFKTTFSNQDSSITVFSGSLSYRDNDKINGTYIRDYGVIFNIPAPKSGYVISTEGSKYDYQFKNGNGNNKKVSKTTIIHKIREFLRNYGTTIGQLNSDDRITVIFDNQASQISTVWINPKSGSKKQNNMVPTISVTAKMSDLNAFRKGSINSSTLDNRLNISTVEKDKNNQTDLKLMDNIFRTAFKDSDVGEFEIKDDVSHIYLDNLGVLFSLNASYNSSLYGILGGLTKKFSGKVTIDSFQVSNKKSKVKTDKAAKKMNELIAERKKSFQTFKTQLKELLIDYGRTLKSIQSDEHIFLSLSVSSPGDHLPEHVNLQIKKSVLDAFDKSKITRKQAMDKISVREY